MIQTSVRLKICRCSIFAHLGKLTVSIFPRASSAELSPERSDIDPPVYDARAPDMVWCSGLFYSAVWPAHLFIDVPVYDPAHMAWSCVRGLLPIIWLKLRSTRTLRFTRGRRIGCLFVLSLWAVWSDGISGRVNRLNKRKFVVSVTRRST